MLEVPVEEEEAGAAEALLRFMYTGELEPPVAGSAAGLLRLLRLADRFQVGAPALGCMCTRLGWSHCSVGVGVCVCGGG